MQSFRRVLFWLHLAAGVVAGAVIGILCLTGVALAFEKPLVAWAERDARRIAAPPTGSERLPLADLTRRAQAANPDVLLTGITVAADPLDAVTFSFGRNDALFADPFTGEVRRPRSTVLRDFLQRMEAWHRFLALGGDQRPLGKAVTGACNLAFCFLAVSGLFLWWPRSWHWPNLKAVGWLRRGLAGRARDFNWHNAIGLWCAPVLIVLTLTAVPISYRWGTSLIYRAAGETPPAASGPVAPAPPALPARAGDAQSLAPDALLTTIQQAYPGWQTITQRFTPARSTETAPAATVFLMRERQSWPRTATTTIFIDPVSGSIVKTEGHSDLTAARRLRTWARFLHTGEALGVVGQAIAAVASLGGCLLVYTGFALAWRRFFPRRNPVQGG